MQISLTCATGDMPPFALQCKQCYSSCLTNLKLRATSLTYKSCTFTMSTFTIWKSCNMAWLGRGCLSTAGMLRYYSLLIVH